MRKFLLLIVLVWFLSPLLDAEDKRAIPLDTYLIIDGSSVPEKTKGDIIAWINQRLVDRILVEGDTIAVWIAGDKAELIHSATLSGAAEKKAVKDKLDTLNLEGETADFSGALRDVSARLSRPAGDRGRLSYTLLITASAEVLVPTLTGNAQNLLRWFRSERYERWQVLVVAPDIGEKVRQSAAAYMNSRR